MKKVMKRLIALLMGMAVLFTAIPCSEALATEDTVPAITVTSTTVTAGNYAYFYVNASNFTDLVGLEYSLHYDADVMSLNWVYTGSFISSSTSDINKDTAGEIKCSIMNVDGLNGNGRLLRIGFKVSADAEPGTYSVTLTIGDAYDSGFNAISITKTSGTLTVNEAETTTTSISFSTVCDKTTVSKGDTFTYTLKAGYTYGLACGNFEFQYDRDLLELTDVSLGKELLTSTAIYSINQDTAGYVKITYADIEAISRSYGIEYFKLTFTVKENVDTTTNIEFAADSLVDANLANMKTKSLTRTLTIKQLEEDVTYPALKLRVNEVTEDGSFSVDVILEAGANVAAGDFVISYDNSQIVCQSVERDATLTENGGYLITKETIDKGNIQFSYVNQNPFTEEQRIAVLKFQADDMFYGETGFQISGKDVVDVDYTNITLEYENMTVDVPVRMVSLSVTLIKGEYYIGDEITIEDFQVIAKYSDGSTKEITEGYTLSDVDMTISGTKEVEIIYGHLSALCEIIVKDCIIGDVDNDGKVNNLDRLILTRHLANWEGYGAEDLNLLAADVDGDGVVNNLDRLILTRHLANWEGYEELPYTN